jgi:hypothetical protein
VLKDAFAQGRLTSDELDSRVGQAFASRTYVELAAVTADIPAWSAIAPPPREPARAPNRAPGTHPVRNGAIVSGVGLIMAAAAALGGPIYRSHRRPAAHSGRLYRHCGGAGRNAGCGDYRMGTTAFEQAATASTGAG